MSDTNDELDPEIQAEMNRRRLKDQSEALHAAMIKDCQANATAHDWPDDYVYDNGMYMNICHACSTKFFGHKRRITCKVCADKFAEKMSAPGCSLD